jgi:Uncharacterized protein conserved in bacteria
MTNARRGIILCADDFGLSPGVSEAIASLIEANRLTATSCMTLTADWPQLAKGLLQTLADRVDVGLHLTLTTLVPLGPMPTLAPQGHLPSLKTLMCRAFAGRIAAQEVLKEFRRQLDAFVGALGRYPDFIDGHQHVHVLPMIREQTLALFADRSLVTAGTYLRVPWEPPARIVRRRTSVDRSLLVAALAAPLRRAAQRLALPANDGFGGVRDFDPTIDYRRFFQRTIAGTGPRPIVMCHPGRVDAALSAVDPVTVAREHELAYFASDAFPEDVAAADCRLVRFRDFEHGIAVPR